MVSTPVCRFFLIRTWHGLDVDIYRAVAAAVFADANKVKFTPLTAKERLTALQSIVPKEYILRVLAIMMVKDL